MMQDAGRHSKKLLISSEVMMRRKAGRRAVRDKGRHAGRN